MKRATPTTAAYGVGLLCLASVGLAIAMAEPVGWETIVGSMLVGTSGSVVAGLCARHWIVLTPPLGLAGLLLALAAILTLGGPGDGGPAAAAAVCLVAMTMAVAFAMAAWLGVVLSGRDGDSPTAEGPGDTQ